MSLKCYRCKLNVKEGADGISAGGKSFHRECFICCYCFGEFGENPFFEVNNALFCMEDYKNLFAPKCSECDEGIVGKAIRNAGASWHPECLKCYHCKEVLDNPQKYTFNQKKFYCVGCYKSTIIPLYSCAICKNIISPCDLGVIKNEKVHTYHYRCYICGKEVSPDFIEDKGKICCKKCYDFEYANICEICKKVIENELSVFVSGKHYHERHFGCAKCGINLAKKLYYHDNKLIYCEKHIKEIRAKSCCVCNCGVTGEIEQINNRYHCSAHAMCYYCFTHLHEPGKASGKKFSVIDGKYCCNKCWNAIPVKARKKY